MVGMVYILGFEKTMIGDSEFGLCALLQYDLGITVLLTFETS